MNLTIRMANLKPGSRDLLALANGEFELGAETREDFDITCHIPEKMGRLSDEELQRKRRENTIIAEVAGGMAGYAIYSVSEGLGFISSLHVKRCFRGFGVGEKLVKVVLSGMRKLGATQAYLKSSSSARDFYRRYGFSEKTVLGSRSEMVLDLK